MRTGAAGVIVGTAADEWSTTGSVLGIDVPMATAIVDAAGARRDYLDETGGRYVHVIAAGGMETSGDIAKALALRRRRGDARRAAVDGGGGSRSRRLVARVGVAPEPATGPLCAVQPAVAAGSAGPGSPRAVDHRRRATSTCSAGCDARSARRATATSRSSSGSRSSSPADPAICEPLPPAGGKQRFTTPRRARLACRYGGQGLRRRRDRQRLRGQRRRAAGGREGLSRRSAGGRAALHQRHAAGDQLGPQGLPVGAGARLDGDPADHAADRRRLPLRCRRGWRVADLRQHPLHAARRLLHRPAVVDTSPTGRPSSRRTTTRRRGCSASSRTPRRRAADVEMRAVAEEMGSATPTTTPRSGCSSASQVRRSTTPTSAVPVLDVPGASSAATA